MAWAKGSGPHFLGVTFGATRGGLTPTSWPCAVKEWDANPNRTAHAWSDYYRAYRDKRAADAALAANQTAVRSSPGSAVGKAAGGKAAGGKASGGGKPVPPPRVIQRYPTRHAVGHTASSFPVATAERAGRGLSAIAGSR